MTFASELQSTWHAPRQVDPHPVTLEEDHKVWSRWFADRGSVRSWTDDQISDDRLLELISHGHEVGHRLLPSAPDLRSAVLRRHDHSDDAFIVEQQKLSLVGSGSRSPLMIQRDLDLAPVAIVLGFDLTAPDINFASYRQALQSAGAAGAAIWAQANEQGLGCCASPGLVRSKLPELGLNELSFSSLWAIVLGHPHPTIHMRGGEQQ